MTPRSFPFDRLALTFSLAVLVSGVLGVTPFPSVTYAADMNDASRVTRAVGHYSAIVDRASSLYHKALSDARKKFDTEKYKADGAYDKATERANRDVTLTINTVKEEVAQSSGFNASLKNKIKGAARDFAVAIARARAVRQGAMAAAMREYTETLKTATATYAGAVKKAESSYRAEAKRWIK